MYRTTLRQCAHGCFCRCHTFKVASVRRDRVWPKFASCHFNRTVLRVPVESFPLSDRLAAHRHRHHLAWQLAADALQVGHVAIFADDCVRGLAKARNALSRCIGSHSHVWLSGWQPECMAYALSRDALMNLAARRGTCLQHGVTSSKLTILD
jgi:hypothetical protein